MLEKTQQSQLLSPQDATRTNNTGNILLTDDGSSFPPAEQVPENEHPRWFSQMKNTWITYFTSHRNQVICAGIGLLIAVGFLTIGFWPTLLIVVFVMIGVLYGRYRDGDRRTRAVIAELIDRLE